jgi:hypothetical protein
MNMGHATKRQKRKEKVAQRMCLAIDCQALIDGDQFMCAGHWRMVPSHVQAGMRLTLEEVTGDGRAFDHYLTRAREAANR